MTKEIKVGDIWKRKKGDEKIVKIIATDSGLVEMKDSNGYHFVEIEKFCEYFDIVEE